MSLDNLMKIQEDYATPISFRLEVPGHSKRITMGLVTHVALHEDMLGIGLRFSIPIAITKLLK